MIENTQFGEGGAGTVTPSGLCLACPCMCPCECSCSCNCTCGEDQNGLGWRNSANLNDSLSDGVGAVLATTTWMALFVVLP